MKKGFLTSLGLAAVLTLGLASMTVNEYRNFKEVYAEDYTASVTIADYASNNNWDNDTNYNIVILDDNATVTTSGTDDAYSKYFTSDNSWRIYQTKSPEIVVSVAEGCELKSVKFTYTSEKTGVITFDGNDIKTNTLVEVSGSSATFGVGNTGSETKGQARITEIEVSYTSNNAPVDKTDEVVALFKTYYHDGDYTKDSVLNTNKEVIKEVAKYFHASADTKYRRTVYTPTGLTMTTSTDDVKYENESKYENGDGNVVHTGFGGNWTVNEPSVEEWFVTLKDFVDASITGWTKTGTVYSHDLVPAKEKEEDGTVYSNDLDPDKEIEEDDLTRMAREFVAPMWLAPNVDNYTYVRFTKLTVEEVAGELVMKLYVDEQDSYKLEPESNNVFSKVTISRNHIWGNPVDLQDGTHQQTCTKNECSVTLQPVDHNFGSGTTCECGAIKSSTASSKLDRKFTGVANGTNYAAWSGKTDSNGIVFAGQSAGSNDTIQLRSDKSNSGIVVTKNGTGKKVAKITIVWYSSTSNGRTLDVYGKNTAYTQVTDLYSRNSSTKGTKIGSIVKGTSTELEITGDYAYIGLRSNSGAMYITSITIEWK